MIDFFHNLDFFFDFNFNRTGQKRKIRSSNRLCQSWFLCQRVRSFTYWDSSFTPGNKKCCFVYKKEIKISPNPNPVGVGESIEKAFPPVLLAQASSQMSMPGMSFQKDSCLLEVKLVHGYTLYSDLSSRERISYAWLKA